MSQSQPINYQRIAEAIAYIQANFKRQPSLEEIAEQVHLSPFHFQRMFSDWAGVSPKKFMQYLSVEYAKQLLQGREATLFEAAQEIGLSGTGRLHDLFVKIEGMTPGEFKNGGENLLINYSFADSPFGEIIVASTPKGICHLAFFSNQSEGEATMKARFPNASYYQLVDEIQQEALFIFQHDWNKLNQIKLHLHGTAFQLKVWEALLRIPMGNLTTYGSIATEIEKPKASRAIGTAIGSNPVAFLIPCHRVIQSSGTIGGYMWGNTRKSAIIGWEAAQLNGEG
ncbi:methylated-DNA--[protein]-cysteine S-methyltransferase [Algoriphagus antarcticus]|uniref:methylated-DNA--[protein]-cysteine S-methyltransferase n=1 Tax=Algoriphagus antarcticus TaxID=238540 RepID=A0A3E0DYM4_9BACT|nr:methylated-DNA--[protein]-cysteine S-methyltransferase [Algoriphagus antarcticus]REG88236.1 AraC family transcriptional regulator of adaptative response/methylated-DNA-[protein]-cysteine methyltransferase [Algoriphagus antarcticus]